MANLNISNQHKSTGKILRKNGRLVRHYVLCPVCHNVKYKNTWYAPDSKLALWVDETRDSVETRRCPACEMQIEGLYKGLVVLHDIPPALKNSVENLILQEAKRVSVTKPQHRILEISETLEGYGIKTSTVILAKVLGKTIQKNFNTCEVQMQYQRKPFLLHKTDVWFKVTEYFKA